MNSVDILSEVFGKDLEKIELALGMPFIANGITWDMIQSHPKAGSRDWAEILDLVRLIQKDEGWGYVYVIKGTHGGVERMKIGKANDLNDRLRLFSVKIPFDIETVAAFYVPEPLKTEREMHVMMSHARLSGEWFDLNAARLMKLKLAGFDAEQAGWAACAERIIAAYHNNRRMPDADYIEYLELLLAMNNIAFQRSGE